MVPSIICQPDNLLAGEELVAVDEDAGDVAGEEDKDDADEDRRQVDLLLHRGSRPRMGHSEKCHGIQHEKTWDNYDSQYDR